MNESISKNKWWTAVVSLNYYKPPLSIKHPVCVNSPRPPPLPPQNRPEMNEPHSGLIEIYSIVTGGEKWEGVILQY